MILCFRANYHFFGLGAFAANRSFLGLGLPFFGFGFMGFEASASTPSRVLGVRPPTPFKVFVSPFLAV